MPMALMPLGVTTDIKCSPSDTAARGQANPQNPCHPSDCGSCDDGNPCTFDDCRFDIFFCNCCTCVHIEESGHHCDDGNVCTISDQCSNGTCVGSPVSDVSCDDGNLCTVSDQCLNGTCAGVPITCDDGDRCTLDNCDPATGLCSHAPLNCDDGSACTVDSCDSATGCVHMGLPAEAGSLAFSDQATVVWNPALGASIYNTYRGTIPIGGLNSRSPIYDHVCFESGDAQLNGATLAVDMEDPPVGTNFYYLVDGESSCGEGPLGTATDGTLRTPITFCPTPP